MSSRDLASIAALFGESHGTPGTFGISVVGGPLSGFGATACGLSAGGDAMVERKGPSLVINEDCVLALDDGRRAIHAVADGHEGHEASHATVELLGHVLGAAGPSITPEEVLGRLHPLAVERGFRDDGSRCTLSLVMLDRDEGTLEGFCLGDSAVFLGNAESGVRRVVAPNTFYMAPWDLGSLGMPPSAHFRIPVRPGDWIVTCSDGVHECRYETPDQSIGADDLETLMIRANRSPEHLVDAVVRVALEGVRGHGGGEDNIGVVASIA